MKQFFKYTLATLCGLLLFSIINFFFVFAVLGSIATLGSGSAVTKSKPHSVYVLDMRGIVDERSDATPYRAAFMGAMGREQEPRYGLDDIISNIRKAKDDPNIDGIYLKGGSLQAGATTMKAIRRELQSFKESGKFVVAYADNYGQGNYYLASCADKLFVNPSGAVSWKGLSVTLTFFQRVLNKLGVEMQVVKVGTFKSAVEPYIRTDMSEANRLQYNVLMNEMWKQMVDEVSESRKISAEELNILADRYMELQPAEDYVTTGMVDSLCYIDGMDSLLVRLCGTKEFRKLSHTDMLTLKTKPEKYKKNKVAVLYAVGEITDDSGDGIVGKKMVDEIGKLTNDEQVKAVVLRVNSPGGSANASEQIHHALSVLKKKKPLVVSMSDYAASGGYYISCGADYIIAESNTLTGSIGIFGLIPNVHVLADKVGVDFDGLSTNRHGQFDENMIFKGMNEEERAMMQTVINRGYDLFTRRCAEGRGISQDSIKSIGEGRVWSGVHALQIGLVDSIGSLDDAVEKAALLAELEEYKTAYYPEPEDELTKLIKMLTGETVIEAWLQNRLGGERYATMKRIEQLTDKASVHARLPYDIMIH